MTILFSGEIAERKYLEWLATRPLGPSEAQLKAAEQKRMDVELWDNIRWEKLT